MSMQRIERIFEYEPMKQGHPVLIGGGAASSSRTVVLHFNSAGPCDVYIKASDTIFDWDEVGEATPVKREFTAFLGRVDGLKTFEIAVAGSFEIMYDSADLEARLFFRTNSGTVVHRENAAPEIFTEMYDRTAIDPKWVEYKAMVDTNAERNARRLMAAVEQRLATHEAAITKRTAQAEPKPAGSPDGSDPQAD